MRYVFVLIVLLLAGCNSRTYPAGATSQQIDHYNYAHPPESKREWMRRSSGDAGKRAVNFWNLPY
jgi:hypothetical protein